MVRLRSATNTLFYPMSYEANFNLAKYIIFAISLHKLVYKIKSFYATSGKNTTFTFPHCHILSGRSTGKTPTCGTKKVGLRGGMEQPPTSHPSTQAGPQRFCLGVIRLNVNPRAPKITHFRMRSTQACEVLWAQIGQAFCPCIFVPRYACSQHL